MIKLHYHVRLIGKIALLTGIAGVSTVVSLPALAQGNASSPFVKEAASSGVASREVDTVLAQSGTTTQTKNLVSLAQESGQFQTLLRAGQAAGLLNTLASRGPYTVFAPSDAAFATLPQGAVEAALRPENRVLLRQILLYHVVPGRVTSSQLSTGTVKTLGGGVSVRVTGDKVVVNDSSVVQPNIQASNGVAHVINRVLLPEGFRDRLASQLSAAQ